MGKTDWSEAISIVALIILVVLCSGDPDIIDGWAKRANAAACVQVE